MKTKRIIGISAIFVLFISLLMLFMSITKDIYASEKMDASNVKAEGVKELKAPLTRQNTHDNVFTKIEALLQDGSGPVTEVSQWQVFRLNADFSLPDGGVHTGDTTTLKIPDKLKFNQTLPFEIKNDAGETIASAVVDGASKTITLTYTDYVENHSGVNGNFFFYVRIDRNNVDGPEDIALDFTVGNTIVHGGTVHFIGIPTPTGNVVSKSGGQLESSVTGSRAFFQVNINTKGENLDSVRVIDSLESYGLTIERDSIRIKRGTWQPVHGDFHLIGETVVTDEFNIEWNEDNTGFSVDLGDVPSNMGYQIVYNVQAGYELIDGEKLDNRVTLLAAGTEVDEKVATITWAVAGGTAEGYVYKIKIIKKGEDGDLLSGAVFSVKRISSGEILGDITTGPTGEAELGGLLHDDYEITEAEAPTGYKLLTEPITISKNDFNENKVAEIEVENKKETKEVEVNKYWIGEELNSCRVYLYRSYEIPDGGSEVELCDEATLTPGKYWHHVFKDLEITSPNGESYRYYVVEEPIVGYVSEVSEDEDGKFFILNRSVETIDIPVTKKWIGPSKEGAIIILKRDNEVIETIDVPLDSEWSHTFRGLPKFDELDGHRIIYDVIEEVPDGYTSKTEGDVSSGFTFTNTNTETIDIPCRKVWIGAKTTEVTISLLRDNEVIETKTLSDSNEWSLLFSELPKYSDIDGHEFIYKVEEERIEGYRVSVEGDPSAGFTITNEVTGEVSVPVTKVWEGPKKESAIISLIANGEKVDEVVLSEKNNWKHTFEGLPKYKNGVEIVYLIEEAPIKDYEVNITGDMKDGFIVKNTNTEKTEVSVKKVWGGKALPKVTVRLFKDGKEIEEIALSKDINWEHTFKNLDVYNKDGSKISYEIKEDHVEGYTQAIIEGEKENSFTIVNTENEGAPPEEEPEEDDEEEPEEEDDYIDTSEEKKVKNVVSPKTGDTTRLIGYIFAIALAMFSLILIKVLKR